MSCMYKHDTLMERFGDGRTEAVALLALVLIIGLAVSVYLYAGPDPFYDDMNYVLLARQAITNGTNFMLNKFGFGFLGIWQISAFFYAFGYGNFQAVASGAVDYVVMVSLIFLSGRKLGGKRGNWFGFVAALMAATSPLIATYVFRTLLDIPLGMVISLSVYLFLKSEDGTHKMLYPGLLGFSVAASIFIKMDGALIMAATIFAVFVIAIADARVGWKKHCRIKSVSAWNTVGVLFFLMGILAAFMIELLMFHAITGNALFAFKYYLNSPNEYYGFGVLHNIGVMFIPYVASESALLSNQVVGPLVDLSILGGIIAVIRRSRPATYLFLIDIIGILYFAIGPTNPSLLLGSGGAYPSIFIQDRFMTMLMPFMALLTAYLIFALSDFISGITRRGVGKLVIALVLLGILYLEMPSFVYAHAENMTISQETGLFHNVMQYVASAAGRGHATIYTNVGIPEGKFAITLYYAAQYYSGFNQNYTFRPVNLPILANNNSAACSNPGGESFLLNLYEPAYKEQNSQTINAWLGDNCTATNVKNFSLNSALPDSMWSIRVYRLTSTS